jgi:hypothetical protein
MVSDLRTVRHCDFTVPSDVQRKTDRRFALIGGEYSHMRAVSLRQDVNLAYEQGVVLDVFQDADCHMGFFRSIICLLQTQMLPGIFCTIGYGSLVFLCFFCATDQHGV